ncbi:MAG TPA: response regulator [Rariglobus sp.]
MNDEPEEMIASSRPLKLLCVQPYWLARTTLLYLLDGEAVEWTFADDDRQMLDMIAKTTGGFDMVLVDHAQRDGASGLRVVRALREAGCTNTLLAIGVEEITGIERRRYAKFDVPFLLLTPENHADLMTHVRGAAVGGNSSA